MQTITINRLFFSIFFIFSLQFLFLIQEIKTEMKIINIPKPVTNLKQIILQ